MSLADVDLNVIACMYITTLARLRPDKILPYCSDLDHFTGKIVLIVSTTRDRKRSLANPCTPICGRLSALWTNSISL